MFLFLNCGVCTELKMTEWKSMVPISSLSQSRIAVMKNVLAALLPGPGETLMPFHKKNPLFGEKIPLPVFG